MALEHTHSAISEAKSLACEASEIHGSPSVRSAAACKIKLRAAFKRVCMSASMLPTLWCSIIGLPNCSRSCARSEERRVGQEWKARVGPERADDNEQVARRGEAVP